MAKALQALLPQHHPWLVQKKLYSEDSSQRPAKEVSRSTNKHPARMTHSPREEERLTRALPAVKQRLC